MKEKLKRVRITDKIEYVKPVTNRYTLTCSGLIINSSAKVMFDTNFGDGMTRELLLSERPDLAIISHYHLDHSIWDRMVLEYTDAELMIPAGEEAYLSNHDYFVEKTAVPYGLGERWRNFTKKFAGYREIKEFTVYDESFDPGLRDVKMEFLSASGHSPGHKSVYFRDEKILFTSDTGLDRFGSWYGWQDCDLAKYIDSILTLKAIKPVVVLTSHEGMIRRNIDEAFDQCLKTFFKREEMIEKKLNKGLSKREIVEEGIFYMNSAKADEPMRTFVFMWDSVMFDHHVKKLNEGGLKKEFADLYNRLM